MYHTKYKMIFTEFVLKTSEINRFFTYNDENYSYKTNFRGYLWEIQYRRYFNIYRSSYKPILIRINR